LTAVLLLLAACGGPPGNDAGAYHYALVEAGSYAASADACAGIVRQTTRSDCLLASLERWQRLEDADCDALDAGLLRDECRFQLAERRLAADDLPGAIASCQLSQFRRPCSWHLVRDVAEATWELPLLEAEAHIGRFADALAIPDAGRHFWTVRFREVIGHRGVLDESDCDGLADPALCRDAVYHLVLDMLKETAGRDPSKTCNEPLGQRVRLGGQPVWALGPITRAAETHWAQRRCSPQDVPPPPGPPPPPLSKDLK
jgi:hypothetical protein